MRWKDTLKERCVKRRKRGIGKMKFSINKDRTEKKITQKEVGWGVRYWVHKINSKVNNQSFEKKLWKTYIQFYLLTDTRPEEEKEKKNDIIPIQKKHK